MRRPGRLLLARLCGYYVSCQVIDSMNDDEVKFILSGGKVVGGPIERTYCTAHDRILCYMFHGPREYGYTVRGSPKLDRTWLEVPSCEEARKEAAVLALRLLRAFG